MQGLVENAMYDSQGEMKRYAGMLSEGMQM